MQIISCPGCDRSLRVPDELLGKGVKCPECGKVFRSTPETPVVAQAAQSQFEADDADELEEDDYGEEPRPRRRKRRLRRDLEPHRGTLILVLGIVSYFFLPFILGPIAWILGSKDLRAMREGRMDPAGESNTNVGRICGIISTILGVVCCGGYGALLLAAAITGGFR